MTASSIHPSVSIITPCYNEAATIGGLLEEIERQTIGPENLEVIIADGGSTDGTRDVIRRFQAKHPGLDIKVVDNPSQTIPAALNTAIAQASGEVIIRLDAHSKPARDYVECCLETLERTGAANVGGQWQIEPGGESLIARSVAAAAAHPLGSGGANYRIGGQEGPVDTVPFGCYRRKWLEHLGPFREDLLTNEDYEFNVRLREVGGMVWFNPEIRSIYYARATLGELARQYARYGYWKAQMLRLFPGSVRLRQVVPPLFVVSTLVLLFIGLALPVAWLGLAVEWGAYGAIVLIYAAIEAARRQNVGVLLGFPLAIVTMHLAWGGAFLLGMIRRASTIERTERAL